MTVSIANQGNWVTNNIHIPFARIKNDKGLRWLYENLVEGKLSEKLMYLVSDTEHLNSCYEVWAFMQQQKYLGALFLCLKAFENKQPNLLTQIDSTLILSTKKAIRIHQHKRSTSHPDFSYLPSPNAKKGEQKKVMPNQYVFPSNNSIRCSSNFEKTTNETPIKSRITTHHHYPNVINFPLRTWNSLIELDTHEDDLVSSRARSKTISQPMHIPYQPIRLTAESLALNDRQKVPFSPYGTSCDSTSSKVLSYNSCSSQRSISLIKCEDIEIHLDRRYAKPSIVETPSSNSITLPTIPATASSSGSSSSPIDDNTVSTFYKYNTGLLSCLPLLNKSVFMDNSEKKMTDATTSSLYSNFVGSSTSGDFVNTFIPREGEKLQRRYGGNGSGSLSPVFSSNFTNQKIDSQNLAIFLQSAQFSRASNDLERENAHFSVSEAMISAIEQMKWSKSEQVLAKQDILNVEQTISKRKLKQRRNPQMDNWDTSQKSIFMIFYLFDLNFNRNYILLENTFSTSSNDSEDSSFSTQEPSSGDDSNLKYLQVSNFFYVYFVFFSYF